MGARQDLVQEASIREDLLLARRGQAYFLRVLSGLSDQDLEARVRGGAERALICARIALGARLTADGLDRLSGVHMESDWGLILSDQAFDEAARFTATLPPIALRNLCTHSGVHLDVSWRDLPPHMWHEKLQIAGRSTAVSDTPLRRAHDVWLGALALGGGRRADLPPTLTESSCVISPGAQGLARSSAPRHEFG